MERTPSSAAAQACAAATLHALPPETLLVLVVLDHPAVRASWSSAVVPLLEAISTKLASLHPGSRLLTAAVVYRPTSTSDLQSLLRPRSTIAKLPFVTGSKFIDQTTKNQHWLERIASSSSSRSQWDWLDSQVGEAFDDFGLSDSGSQGQHERSNAPALEALVGALELLDTRSSPATAMPPPAGYACLAPQRPAVMAKHVLHISSCDSLLQLDITTSPILNQSVGNDNRTAAEVCAELANRSISVSSFGFKATEKKDPATPAPATSMIGSDNIEKLHRLITGAAHLADDDTSQLLPAPLKTRLQERGTLLVSGIAAAPPPAASKKRTREDEEEESTSTVGAAQNTIKRAKSGSISKEHPPTFQFPAGINAASLSAQAAALQQKIPKLHPSVSTKIIFLKQQQEAMFRNLSMIAAQLLKAENEGQPKNPAPGMTRPYLEQLRNQIIAQQQGLRMLIQKVITGSEQNPNFNICLQSLVNIDKEAKEMGVILGGPSSGQPGGARAARSASVTSNGSASSSQAPVQPNVGGNARGGAPNMAAQSSQGGQPAPAQGQAQAQGQGQGQGRPKPFWKGPITWSVISDPVTKAKKEISTYVSATSNANAFDKLMLPWPEKLQITAISQLSPRNLQIYAQSQGAPYVLFSAEASSGDGNAANPAERSSSMYASLASSLDAKKSCAFIRHGSSAGSGLVLFATTQPTNSAERNVPPGSVPPKLIGVLFKDPVPFARLLSAQATQQQQLQQQAQGGGGSQPSAQLQAQPAPMQQQAAPPSMAQQPSAPPLQQQQPPPPQLQQPAPLQQPQSNNSATMGNAAPMGAFGGIQPSDLANLAQLLGLGAQGATAAGLMGGAPNMGAAGGMAAPQQQQPIDTLQQQQQQQQGAPQGQLPAVTIEQLRALGLLQ